MQRCGGAILTFSGLHAIIRQTQLRAALSVTKDLIEQWGSGLNRMSNICLQQGISPPKFEELGHFFRVTLYPKMAKATLQEPWYTPIFEHIQQHGKISALEAVKTWKVARRTASNRLKLLCQEGLLIEISSGPFDPYKVFVLAKPGNKAEKT